MKKNKFGILVMIGLASTLLMSSCKEEDPTKPNENSPVLTEKTNASIYNFQGPQKGAWDLVGDSAVGATASNTIKDLIDQSVVMTGAGVVFTKTWGTSTGTMFVKAKSTFDYSNATEASAKEAYEAETNAFPSTGVLATGDIYIAYNSRFPHHYAVIKIVSVNETSSDNNDYISFNYKK